MVPFSVTAVGIALPAESFRASSRRAAFSWRWALLLGFSVVLHWLALGSLSRHLGHMHLFPVPTQPAITQVSLSAAPAAQAKPVTAAAPTKQPAAPAATDPLSSLPLSQPALPSHAANATGLPDTGVPVSDEALLAETASLTSDQVAGSDAEPLPEQAQDTVPRYKAVPPPSATLKYDVEALRKGNMMYGSGKILWHSDGQRYAIQGEASILFFTLLDFQSQGVIDQYGVSPVLYSQKRLRRSATNTHFHRERNLISFSASTLSYPRRGGEQDRASLIWQLAAIGRADPAQFVSGGDISFLVAGVRDMQNWAIKVLLQEEVDTGEGRFLAWRVTRIPPPGSHEQRLDIWLAPELGWYPVKLRHTDYNGEYLNMILSDLAAHAAD